MRNRLKGSRGSFAGSKTTEDGDRRLARTAARRRERVAEAQRAYEQFLTEIAIPVSRQLANAMKAEGYAFTVFTPGDGLSSPPTAGGRFHRAGARHDRRPAGSDGPHQPAARVTHAR